MRNAGKVKVFDRTIFLSFLSLSIGYKQQKKENKLFTTFFFPPTVLQTWPVNLSGAGI